MARGGEMVPGKKMKNEAVRKKGKGEKEKRVKSPLKWSKNSSF